MLTDFKLNLLIRNHKHFRHLSLLLILGSHVQVHIEHIGPLLDSISCEQMTEIKSQLKYALLHIKHFDLMIFSDLLIILSKMSF